MNCCSRWYRFWGQVSVFSSIRSLGGTLAEVRAINDRGEVVGIGITAKGPIQYYALLWRPKPKKPKR